MRSSFVRWCRLDIAEPLAARRYAGEQAGEILLLLRRETSTRNGLWKR